MVRQLSVFLLSLMMASGCAAWFKSPHRLFVESMDQYVQMGKTINELQGFTHIAAPRYLADVETLEDGDLKYHYAHATIWEDRYCYYYFLVDGETNVVKGWDFDYAKGDPRRDCGRSG